ncbi:LOW QUALITY PROTEIN: P-loop containing nucleoside triphosphate hydrolase protein, partial [Jimgerdemannia flammicorona]
PERRKARKARKGLFPEPLTCQIITFNPPHHPRSENKMSLRASISRVAPALRSATARPSTRILPVKHRLLSTTPVRRFSSEAPPSGKKQSGGPSVPALLAVASLGFASYYILVHTRKGQDLVKSKSATADKVIEQKAAAFDPKDVTAVLAPARAPNPNSSGATTASSIFLVCFPQSLITIPLPSYMHTYSLLPILFFRPKAGDLLRDEQKRPNSEYSEMIQNCLKNGLIVPHRVTIALLENAMREAVQAGKTRFLIDGFPRKIDQAIEFESVVTIACDILIIPRPSTKSRAFILGRHTTSSQVVPSRFVLYFECPEEEMLKRLLNRGKTSGRVDDNLESIKKRFQTFIDTSYPVIEAYEKQGKVHSISCVNSPDVVYGKVKKIFNELFNENV